VAPGGGQADGVVELASYLGATREHLVRLGPDLAVVVRDPTGGAVRLHQAGEAVGLRWDLGAERVFGAGASPLLPLPPGEGRGEGVLAAARGSA